jgi:hypothetical protein
MFKFQHLITDLYIFQLACSISIFCVIPVGLELDSSVAHHIFIALMPVYMFVVKSFPASLFIQEENVYGLTEIL